MQEQLFGVKPKVVTALAITMDGLDDFSTASITIYVHPKEKRDLTVVRISPNGRKSLSATLGMLNSVLHKGYGMDYETIRLDLWRVVAWAAREGMTYDLTRMGQPPAWFGLPRSNSSA